MSENTSNNSPLGFIALATDQLTIPLLVSPIDFVPSSGPVQSKPKAVSELGLPQIELMDSLSRTLPGQERFQLEGHVKVLGVKGLLSLCDRHFVIYIIGEGVRVGTVCDLPAYLVRIPINIDLPFVELSYGSSLTNAIEPMGPCSTSGSYLRLSGSFDPGSRKITLRVEGRAKLKCWGRTIINETGSTTIDVTVDELPVCGIGDADISGNVFGAKFKAKACYGGSYVKITNACIYASWQGNEFELACADNIIIPIPTAIPASAPKECGCE
ncbi:hypothetical protein [Tautonia rosea]|uniref:hypothetical protein n=1 Tax=Tautonia rosea TaxID=2728037 RepID=UPI00147470FE|nr:hypothetical protein [Tautonia rosea]